MEITGLSDRNKITIRRQRRSRQQSNYTSDHIRPGGASALGPSPVGVNTLI